MIDYLAIRRYFFSEFEKQYQGAIQAHEKMAKLNGKIQSQTQKVQALEKQLEAIRPEVEDIQNLEMLLSMGGQSLPVMNTAKDKLEQTQHEIEKIKKESVRVNNELKRVKIAAQPLSRNNYATYRALLNTDFSLQKIKDTKAYSNCESLESNLRNLYVIAHIEDDNIFGIREEYFDGLFEKTIPGCDMDLLNDEICQIRFRKTLMGDFTDESLRKIYDKLSDSTKAVMTYEEYCFDGILSISKKIKKRIWIAEKLNMFFIGMGKTPFSARQGSTVRDVFKYLLEMEEYGSTSATLWRGIELPPDLFTGNDSTICSDVESAFKIWMYHYRNKIYNFCFNHQEQQSWYKQFDLNNHKIHYDSFLRGLVDDEIKRRCEGKTYLRNLDFQDIVRTIDQYDDTNPEFRKKFEPYRKKINNTVQNPEAGKAAGKVTAKTVEKKPDKTEQKAARHVKLIGPYRLTSAHMVFIMFQTVYASCTLHKGFSFLIWLVMTGSTSLVGLFILNILHASDKRVEKAKTIVSSISGFMINTSIIAVLVWIELLYLRKLGVSVLHCVAGVFAAVLVYAMYLLMVIPVNKKDGGDK